MSLSLIFSLVTVAERIHGGLKNSASFLGEQSQERELFAMQVYWKDAEFAEMPDSPYSTANKSLKPLADPDGQQADRAIECIEVYRQNGQSVVRIEEMSGRMDHIFSAHRNSDPSSELQSFSSFAW